MKPMTMSRWRSDTMGPICVASSIGSPMTADFVRSVQTVEECLAHAVLHENPRPVRTDLPGRVEIRVDRAPKPHLRRRVVEDDQG
jgi:hypothetical protein